MRGTRHLGRAAGLVLLLPALLVAAAAPAAASCVPSEVAVTPATAAPGDALTVSSGTWFGVCNDTGQRVDVTDRAVVTFVQGARRLELGRTNSDARGRFTLTVRVPRTAVPGPARLEVRGRAATDDADLTVTPAVLPLTGPGPAGPAGLAAVLAASAALAVRRATV